MSRAKADEPTRVIARVTLVTGQPGALVTIAPGQQAEFPPNEAQRLIADGHADPFKAA